MALMHFTAVRLTTRSVAGTLCGVQAFKQPRSVPTARRGELTCPPLYPGPAGPHV